MILSAVFSPCGTWRYLLEREWAQSGLTFVFAGVNPSKAGAEVRDQTDKKWVGFSERNGGRRYLAINPLAGCSTDVRLLADMPDPVGPDNAIWHDRAIAEADVLVPCWGNRSKIPKHLHRHLDDLLTKFRVSGKPIKTFGFTKSGDPTHPQMLGYNTPLIDWTKQ